VAAEDGSPLRVTQDVSDVSLGPVNLKLLGETALMFPPW
jgi:hypothetical protein